MKMRPPVKSVFINELFSRRSSIQTNQFLVTYSLACLQQWQLNSGALRWGPQRFNYIRPQYFMIPSFRFNPIFSWLPCNCQLHEVAHWWRVVRKVYICADRWGVCVETCRYVNSIKRAGRSWSFLDYIYLLRKKSLIQKDRIFFYFKDKIYEN